MAIISKTVTNAIFFRDDCPTRLPFRLVSSVVKMFPAYIRITDPTLPRTGGQPSSASALVLISGYPQRVSSHMAKHHLSLGDLILSLCRLLCQKALRHDLRKG